jgi:hypothetical protein
MRRLPIQLLLIVLPVAAQDPGVFIAAPTGPSVRMFDPANPPIPLRPPEAAITRFEPIGRAGHPQIFFDGTTLTVVRMDSPSLAANIVIFLPYNATPNITEHENGHARLCQYEYAKVAQRLTAAAWSGFAGMRFVGRGTTTGARQADALGQIDAEGKRRTTQAVFSVAAEVSKLNDNPAIDTAKGEIMAKQQMESAVQRTLAPARTQSEQPARGRRSSRNRILAFAAMGLGGFLLIYGVLSYARR